MTALSLYPWTFDKPSHRMYRGQKGIKPFTNISKDDSGYRVEISVPGFSKDEINVKVDKNTLTISGKYEKSEENNSDNFIKKEFSKSNFSVEYTLTETINQESIEAEVLNGILTVKLPFKAEVKKDVLNIAVK